MWGVLALAMLAGPPLKFDHSLPPLAAMAGEQRFRLHFEGGIDVVCYVGRVVPAETVWTLTVAKDGSATVTESLLNCDKPPAPGHLTAAQAQPLAGLFDPATYANPDKTPCLDGDSTRAEMTADGKQAAVEFQCSGPARLESLISKLRGVIHEGGAEQAAADGDFYIEGPDGLPDDVFGPTAPAAPGEKRFRSLRAGGYGRFCPDGKTRAYVAATLTVHADGASEVTGRACGQDTGRTALNPAQTAPFLPLFERSLYQRPAPGDEDNCPSGSWGSDEMVIDRHWRTTDFHCSPGSPQMAALSDRLVDLAAPRAAAEASH